MPATNNPVENFDPFAAELDGEVIREEKHQERRGRRSLLDQLLFQHEAERELLDLQYMRESARFLKAVA